MRRIWQCSIVILLMCTRVGAQDGFSERARKYVDEYASLAMAEQRRSKVPAAITLGQGILETEAGISELMTEANNHFGIKCKNGWTGPTFTHTDDAPDECFKKYTCAAESFKDHSDHLKRNQRYSVLFTLKQEDYKNWAVCLKKCGYATNPQYAQRLIKIIEDYGLQQYTLSAFDSSILNNYENNPVASAQPGEHIPYQQPVAKTGVPESGVGYTPPAHKGNAIGGDTQPQGDYIAINRTKTPVGQAAKTTTTNPAPAKTPEEKPKPIIIIEEPNKRQRPPAPPPDMSDPEVKKEMEFKALKAELDKVVYADDSKLITESKPTADPTPVPEKKQVINPDHAAPKKGKYYTVKKGDTAFSIAKKNDITLEQLVEWNNLGSGGVKVGQTLKVNE